jgi:hypothetical protein
LVLAVAAGAEEPDELRVRTEIAAGRHFVGEGFELRVGVLGADQRPQVERPRIAGAEVWEIGTDLKPISTSGIGAVVSQANLFVSRFRVVARRAGALEIPAIRAEIGGRSGRSQPRRVLIRSVPPQGRPAEFLGGVGRFGLEARVTPQVVRVGQELDFRITVTGPAAWGMVERPDLPRYERLGIGLRIEPKPDELIPEPPSRTFVYSLRPTRAGEVVLPPVVIAAFDPEPGRYLTRATAGVSVRVVAVATFDPATLDIGEPEGGSGGSIGPVAAAGCIAAVLLAGAAAGLAWIRRREGLRLRGPSAARRYAAGLARRLGANPPIAPGDRDGTGAPVRGGEVEAPGRPGGESAWRIGVELIRYLEIGLGRPPGALTPEEARRGVALCSGSDELGARAGRLAAHCDAILYRAASGPPWDDSDGLIDEARGLFAALGRVKAGRPSSPGDGPLEDPEPVPVS